MTSVRYARKVPAIRPPDATPQGYPSPDRPTGSFVVVRKRFSIRISTQTHRFIFFHRRTLNYGQPLADAATKVNAQ